MVTEEAKYLEMIQGRAREGRLNSEGDQTLFARLRCGQARACLSYRLANINRFMDACQALSKTETTEDRVYRKVLNRADIESSLHSFGYIVPAYTTARAAELVHRGDFAGAWKLVAPVLREFGDFECTGRSMLLRTMNAIEKMQAAFIALKDIIKQAGAIKAEGEGAEAALANLRRRLEEINLSLVDIPEVEAVSLLINQAQSALQEAETRIEEARERKRIKREEWRLAEAARSKAEAERLRQLEEERKAQQAALRQEVKEAQADLLNFAREALGYCEAEQEEEFGQLENNFLALRARLIERGITGKGHIPTLLRVADEYFLTARQSINRSKIIQPAYAEITVIQAQIGQLKTKSDLPIYAQLKALFTLIPWNHPDAVKDRLIKELMRKIEIQFEVFETIFAAEAAQLRKELEQTMTAVNNARDEAELQQTLPSETLRQRVAEPRPEKLGFGLTTRLSAIDSVAQKKGRVFPIQGSVQNEIDTLRNWLFAEHRGGILVKALRGEGAPAANIAELSMARKIESLLQAASLTPGEISVQVGPARVSLQEALAGLALEVDSELAKIRRAESALGEITSGLNNPDLTLSELLALENQFIQTDPGARAIKVLRSLRQFDLEDGRKEIQKVIKRNKARLSINPAMMLVGRIIHIVLSYALFFSGATAVCCAFEFGLLGIPCIVSILFALLFLFLNALWVTRIVPRWEEYRRRNKFLWMPPIDNETFVKSHPIEDRDDIMFFAAETDPRIVTYEEAVRRHKEKNSRFFWLWEGKPAMMGKPFSAPLTVLLGVITVMAIFLRFYNINFNGEFVDESLYSNIWPDLNGEKYIKPSGSKYIYPVMGLIANLIGGTYGLRILAAICGLLTIYSVYKMAKMISEAFVKEQNRARVAWLSALLYGLSAPALFISNLGTYDAPGIMFFAFGLWQMLKGIKENRKKSFVLAVVSLSLALASRYALWLYLPFVLFVTAYARNLYLPGLLKKSVKAAEVVSVFRIYFVLPFTLFVLGYFFISGHDILALHSLGMSFIGKAPMGRGAIFMEALVMALPVLVTTGLCWVVRAKPFRAKSLVKKEALVLLWFLTLGVALVIIYHIYMAHDIALLKNLNLSVLFGAILGGIFLNYLIEKCAKFSPVLLALIFGLNINQSVEVVRNEQQTWPDWRALVKATQETIEGKKHVVIWQTGGWGTNPLLLRKELKRGHYEPFKGEVLPELTPAQVELLVEEAKKRGDYVYVDIHTPWFMYGNNQADQQIGTVTAAAERKIDYVVGPLPLELGLKIGDHFRGYKVVRIVNVPRGPTTYVLEYDKLSPGVAPHTRYGRIYYAWVNSPRTWQRKVAQWIAEWYAPRREALKYGLSANGTERFKKDHQGLPNCEALFKRVDDEKWFSLMHESLRKFHPLEFCFAYHISVFKHALHNWGVRVGTRPGEPVGVANGAKSKPGILLAINYQTGPYGQAWDPGQHILAGTLASPLRDKEFLHAFAQRLGKNEIIQRDASGYPDFDIRVLNLGNKPADATIETYVRYYMGSQRGFKPIIVGLTALSEEKKLAVACAAAFKKFVPQALRVIGGVLVSVEPEWAMKNTEFQIGCIGESVETFCEIALLAARAPGATRLSDFSGVAGIVRKGENAAYQPRQAVLELDKYPFAAKSLDLFYGNLTDFRDNRNRQVAILTDIGCHRNCFYCGQRAIYNGCVRLRGPESVMEEVRYLMKMGFRWFAFTGNNVAAGQGRLEKLVDLINKADLDIIYTIGACADDISVDLLRKMAHPERKRGLVFLELGVETSDKKVLKGVGKGLDLEHLKDITKFANQLGVGVHWYLLLGLPGQDWQSVYRTARFLDDVQPLPWGWFARNEDHNTVIVVPYPGTRIASEQSVRIVNPLYEGWIPSREPEVRIEDGKFVGTNHTETDAMLAEEIFEAKILLHDFYYLRLRSLDAPISNRQEYREYCDKAFCALERRVIRGLIVCAQENLTYASRKKAYQEIMARDGDKEARINEYTQDYIGRWPLLEDFLSQIRFENGYEVMRELSIANRVKWMHLNAVLWGFFQQPYRIRFQNASADFGKILDRGLSLVKCNFRDFLLAPRVISHDANKKQLEFLGLNFVYDTQDNVLTVCNLGQDQEAGLAGDSTKITRRQFLCGAGLGVSLNRAEAAPRQAPGLNPKQRELVGKIIDIYDSVYTLNLGSKKEEILDSISFREFRLSSSEKVALWAFRVIVYAINALCFMLLGRYIYEYREQRITKRTFIGKLFFCLLFPLLYLLWQSRGKPVSLNAGTDVSGEASGYKISLRSDFINDEGSFNFIQAAAHELAHALGLPNNRLLANAYAKLVLYKLGVRQENGDEDRVDFLGVAFSSTSLAALADPVLREATVRKTLSTPSLLARCVAYIEDEKNSIAENHKAVQEILKEVSHTLRDEDYKLPQLREGEYANRSFVLSPAGEPISWAYIYGSTIGELAYRTTRRQGLSIDEAFRYIYLLGKAEDARETKKPISPEPQHSRVITQLFGLAYFGILKNNKHAREGFLKVSAEGYLKQLQCIYGRFIRSPPLWLFIPLIPVYALIRPIVSLKEDKFIWHIPHGELSEFTRHSLWVHEQAHYEGKWEWGALRVQAEAFNPRPVVNELPPLNSLEALYSYVGRYDLDAKWLDFGRRPEAVQKKMPRIQKFFQRHGAVFRYLGYLHIGLMLALLMINAFGGMSYYFLYKDLAFASGQLIYPAAAAIDIGTGMVSWFIADMLTQGLQRAKRGDWQGYDWLRLAKITFGCGSLQILTHILYNVLQLIPAWCPWFVLLPVFLQFGLRLICILTFGVIITIGNWGVMFWARAKKSEEEKKFYDLLGFKIIWALFKASFILSFIPPAFRVIFEQYCEIPSATVSDGIVSRTKPLGFERYYKFMSWLKSHKGLFVLAAILGLGALCLLIKWYVPSATFVPNFDALRNFLPFLGIIGCVATSPAKEEKNFPGSETGDVRACGLGVYGIDGSIAPEIRQGVIRNLEAAQDQGRIFTFTQLSKETQGSLLESAEIGKLIIDPRLRFVVSRYPWFRRFGPFYLWRNRALGRFISALTLKKDTGKLVAATYLRLELAELLSSKNKEADLSRLLKHEFEQWESSKEDTIWAQRIARDIESVRRGYLKAIGITFSIACAAAFIGLADCLLFLGELRPIVEYAGWVLLAGGFLYAFLFLRVTWQTREREIAPDMIINTSLPHVSFESFHEFAERWFFDGPPIVRFSLLICIYIVSCAWIFKWHSILVAGFFATAGIIIFTMMQDFICNLYFRSSANSIASDLLGADQKKWEDALDRLKRLLANIHEGDLWFIWHTPSISRLSRYFILNGLLLPVAL
ncbi:MAG: radical SAM protein [Candidatus Omnitrophica bacterium]|nr:radical SAM protein [Candidatus Omnitrophota bacterium]